MPGSNVMGSAARDEQLVTATREDIGGIGDRDLSDQQVDVGRRLERGIPISKRADRQALKEQERDAGLIEGTGQLTTFDRRLQALRRNPGGVGRQLPSYVRRDLVLLVFEAGPDQTLDPMEAGCSQEPLPIEAFGKFQLVAPTERRSAGLDGQPKFARNFHQQRLVAARTEGRVCLRVLFSAKARWATDYVLVPPVWAPAPCVPATSRISPRRLI